MGHDCDYSLRGKCKSMCQDAVLDDPSLKLVRGYYHCPSWGKQAHWWTVREDGTIFDPTKNQFPSQGAGEYVEFDGYFECEECGKRIHEDDCIIYGNYQFCSDQCVIACVLG